MAEIKKFKPKGIGEILDSTSAEDQHLIESVYWPHVDQVGKRIPLGALPRTLIHIEPLGDIAQAAFRNHRARSNVGHIQWDDTSYLAYPAGVYKFNDVIIHSHAGLICYGRSIVSETLWHTDTKLHNYERDNDGNISINQKETHTLKGRTLSLLGHADNYFHSVVDGIARLALLSDVALTGLDYLLLPKGGMGQAELLSIHGIPPNVTVVYVSPHETFYVEELIFPFSLHGLFDFTPQLNAFFDRVIAHIPVKQNNPEYVYIDRRGGSLRKLANENDVVSAMERLGFYIARLENISQVEQIELFQNARMIVGPHGAGLTNIAFSRPGTVLIELMMDAYCNWCFRRLAHMRGAKYDCVLGHAIGEWKGDQDGAIHSQTWEISVLNIISTVKPLMFSAEPRRRGLNVFGVYG